MIPTELLRRDQIVRMRADDIDVPQLLSDAEHSGMRIARIAIGALVLCVIHRRALCGIKSTLGDVTPEFLGPPSIFNWDGFEFVSSPTPGGRWNQILETDLEKWIALLNEVRRAQDNYRIDVAGWG